MIRHSAFLGIGLIHVEALSKMCWLRALIMVVHDTPAGVYLC